MWTSDQAALAAADQRFCELLGCASLRLEDRLYTRLPQPERWSTGLCKRLFDVQYRGWQPSLRLRLVWDPERQQEVAWNDFPFREPPADWQRDPLASPVTDTVQLERLRRHVQDRLRQSVYVDKWVSHPRRGQPRCTVFEGEIWAAIPNEQILIRLNADTGDLMGWRHAAWFAPGDASEPAGLDEEALRQAVEALALFPRGMARGDAWSSTDRPGHCEMLWRRFEQGEEVENDTLYACVNRFSGKVAECVLNWSPLVRELNLDAPAALEAFAAVFTQQFPGAIRCGTVRRMYVEIPDQAAKRRAWVANAMDTSGPVQIALGSGGVLLRADSVT